MQTFHLCLLSFTTLLRLVTSEVPVITALDFYAIQNPVSLYSEIDINKVTITIPTYNVSRDYLKIIKDEIESLEIELLKNDTALLTKPVKKIYVVLAEIHSLYTNFLDYVKRVQHFMSHDDAKFLGCVIYAKGFTADLFTSFQNRLLVLIKDVDKNVTLADTQSNNEKAKNFYQLLVGTRTEFEVINEILEDRLFKLEGLALKTITPSLLTTIRKSSCDTLSETEIIKVNQCYRTKNNYVCNLVITELIKHSDYGEPLPISYFNKKLSLANILANLNNTNDLSSYYCQDRVDDRLLFCSINKTKNNCLTSLAQKSMKNILEQCTFLDDPVTKEVIPLYNAVLLYTGTNLTFTSNTSAESVDWSHFDKPYLVLNKDKLTFNINGIEFEFGANPDSQNIIKIPKFNEAELLMFQNHFKYPLTIFFDAEKFKDPVVILVTILILILIAIIAYICKARLKIRIPDRLIKLHPSYNSRKRKREESQEPRELRKFLRK